MEPREDCRVEKGPPGRYCRVAAIPEKLAADLRHTSE